MRFEPAEFKTDEGATRVGYSYGPLALHKLDQNLDEWVVTHLRSGKAICNIEGTMDDAFRVCMAMADCINWEFDTVEELLKNDDQAKDKLGQFSSANTEVLRRPGSSFPARAA